MSIQWTHEPYSGDIYHQCSNYFKPFLIHYRRDTHHLPLCSEIEAPAERTDMSCYAVCPKGSASHEYYLKITCYNDAGPDSISRSGYIFLTRENPRYPGNDECLQYEKKTVTSYFLSGSSLAEVARRAGEAHHSKNSAWTASNRRCARNER